MAVTFHHGFRIPIPIPATSEHQLIYAGMPSASHQADTIFMHAGILRNYDPPKTFTGILVEKCIV